jgi:hypothetical protein
MRWFYQYAINYRTYNVFETSEYSSDQGYATKAEAVNAAILHACQEIKVDSSQIEWRAQRILDISKEKNKLEGMINESISI